MLLDTTLGICSMWRLDREVGRGANRATGRQVRACLLRRARIVRTHSPLEGQNKLYRLCLLTIVQELVLACYTGPKVHMYVLQEATLNNVWRCETISAIAKAAIPCTPLRSAFVATRTGPKSGVSFFESTCSEDGDVSFGPESTATALRIRTD